MAWIERGRDGLKKVGWMVAALATATGLKAGLLTAGVIPFNSDEAVVALMARHILSGERPVFFYGQAYMGSLDALLVAGGFHLFGEEAGVIRLVQTLLYLGVLVTTGLLGRQIFGSWKVGTLAIWLLAIPTVNLTLYTTASLGGYGEALLIGNLLLGLSIRIATERSGRISDWNGLVKSRCIWLWAAWGFLAGLGLWAFGLTLVYTLPTALLLGYHLLKPVSKKVEAGTTLSTSVEIKAVRGDKYGLFSQEALLPATATLGAALTGILAGSAPWWIYALQNGHHVLFSELGGSAIAGSNQVPWLVEVGTHLVNLVLLGIPVIIGLRPPWSVDWLGLPLLPLVLFFWMGVGVYSVRRLHRAVAARENQLLLAGVILTNLAGFLLTPFGKDPSGRYFLPLSIPLALFAANTIVSLRPRLGLWVWVLTTLVIGYQLWGNVQCAMRFPPGITTQFYPLTQIDHRYDAELIRFLKEKGETRGYTNYWVSYPLAFLSGEELIFLPRLPYHADFRYTERDDRYEPYEAVVAEAERAAYITTRHSALNARLREGFDRRGVGYLEAQIGDYHVFYQLTMKVIPQELGLGRSHP